MTFYFFVRGETKREQGDPGIKPLKAGGSRSVISTVRISVSACCPSDQLRNSSLFFPLIISYCQLRLVLATYSLLFVNSVGPHSKLRYNTRAEAMTGSLVLCNQH